jgi:hypothetical protein
MKGMLICYYPYSRTSGIELLWKNLKGTGSRKGKQKNIKKNDE